MEGNAVVIGAGIAGLAVAQVLSLRYESVTVLDRDSLPDQAEPRRGVPQGAQPHILLLSGLHRLNELFPGFEQELIAAGGVKFDTGADLAVHRGGGFSERFHAGMALVSASRPQMELIIRRRVASLPRVVIRQEVAVSALAGSAGAVTGVVLDEGETIDADLVVDCTGRGSRSDRWLATLGFPAAEQLEVRVGVGYATRIYRRQAGVLGGYQAVLAQPGPPQKMSGVVLPIEGDRWMVDVNGWHTVPPDGVAEFERFAKALPDGLISAVTSQAEPLSDVMVYRFPASRRRLFEKLRDLPAGYVALGDAVCSFNPIYGQGMTCAIEEAVALGDTLDNHGGRPDASMAKAFYRAVARIIATPWQFAVGNDFNYPETSGRRPRGIKISNWYARQIISAAQIDPTINRSFIAVQQLVAPLTGFFRPAFVFRVMRTARKRRKATC